MEITTMVGCPLRCTFCPQDALKSAYGKEAVKYMSFETFEICLSKIPKHCQIDFAGMSEPWANPACTKMLALTLERGYRASIFTTLYGMGVADARYIATELLSKYAKQIDVVCLHLPDANGNMRGYKGSAQYRTVLQTIAGAHNVLGNRLNAMTMDRSGRVHPDLQDLVPRLPAWQGHDRAGSLGEEQTKKTGACGSLKKTERVICGATNYYDHNVLLPDGTVVLCCMDYGAEKKLANLLTQDYWDIFSSPVLTELRIANQKPGYSPCSICKRCTCSVVS